MRRNLINTMAETIRMLTPEQIAKFESKPIFDLVALEKALAPDGQHARLRGLIHKTRSAASIEMDIADAKGAIAMLGDLQSGNTGIDPGGPIAARLMRALTLDAIILYCRATKTETKHRMVLSPLGWFTPEQRKAHDRITRLRDDSLAHYGPGEDDDGKRAWNKEVLLLDTKLGGLRRASIHANIRVDDIQPLVDLVNLVHRKVIEKSERYRHEMLLELSRTFERDQSLADDLMKAEFDPRKFFETEEQVAMFESGGQGQVETWIPADAQGDQAASADAASGFPRQP